MTKDSSGIDGQEGQQVGELRPRGNRVDYVLPYSSPATHPTLCPMQKGRLMLVSWSAVSVPQVRRSFAPASSLLVRQYGVTWAPTCAWVHGRIRVEGVLPTAKVVHWDGNTRGWSVAEIGK